MPSVIAGHAARDPDGVALIEGERRMSWGELDTRLQRVAAGLAARGVGRRDRVAVLSRNSIEYVVVFFGALRAGACVVPLPTMATGEALRLMLVDSASKVLLVSAAYREAIEAQCAEIPSLGDGGLIGLDFGDERWESLESMLTGAPSGVPDGAPSAPQMPITGSHAFDIMYSSGTTGTPKGILHSHAARRASYAGPRARYFSAGSVNIVATPFYSNTTCATWLLATALSYPSVIMAKFDAGRFMALVEQHRVTHSMIVPVQYERILEHDSLGNHDLSSLRYKFCTSAPLRAEVKRRILDKLPGEMIEIFGLTEGGVVTVLDVRMHQDKLESVGQAVASCELRIIDADGKPVAAGETGEVVGRGANMMSGYVNRPDATAEITWRDAEGRLFFRSGDIGRLDADGFLYLLDRKKDVIISGGLNIYASDLEQVLSEHGQVLDVAVVAAPSKRWGETPVAFVVVTAADPVTGDALRHWCNQRVGKAQRLSEVRLVDELPRSAIGKVLKRELRERLC